jgi:DNA-binding transcriptional LysR family regulator
MARQFNIGFIASTLYDKLPELIQHFRLAVHDCDVHLVEMITLEQITALKDGHIDVGFGRLRFEDEAIARKVIREEPLCLAVPMRRALANARKARLCMTVGEPLILYPSSPRPSFADQVLSFYADAGIEPIIDMEVRELQTALGPVAAGAGVCIVPASVRRLGRDDIRYVELDEPMAPTMVGRYVHVRDADLLVPNPIGQALARLSEGLPASLPPRDRPGS